MLFRLAADAELSREQSAALDALHARAGAEVSARVAFEHALRDSVARVMGEAPAAPEALRRRILDSLRAEDQAPAPQPLPFRAAPAASDGARPSPFRFGWLVAAAAMVVVGAVATLSPRFIGSTGGPAPQAASIIPAATAQRLVSFLDEHHGSCANFGEVFQQKMAARTQAEATRAAIEILTKVPDVLELPDDRLASMGYQFAGLGRCAVPGEGRSAHLLYRSLTEGAPPISLFVQEDTGSMKLDGKCCYCAGLCKDGKTQINIWKRGGIVYYLVTPKELLPAAREVFGAPSKEQPLL
ncbi:MAG TPA: hypothetical protein DEB06_05720 [Phycisphaerales bacterium]|nr:hypothetical protein [Phycisphaerales bacterium]